MSTLCYTIRFLVVALSLRLFVLVSEFTTAAEAATSNVDTAKLKEATDRAAEFLKKCSGRRWFVQREVGPWRDGDCRGGLVAFGSASR